MGSTKFLNICDICVTSVLSSPQACQTLSSLVVGPRGALSSSISPQDQRSRGSVGRHHPLLLPDPAGKTGQTPPEYNSVSLNLVLLLFLLLLLLLLSLFLLLLLLKILHIYFSTHLAACCILFDSADPLLLFKYLEGYLGCLCPLPPGPLLPLPLYASSPLPLHPGLLAAPPVTQGSQLESHRPPGNTGN